MSRDALLALVRERLGLDPATLGERVLDDACADARRRFGVADDAALYRRVLFDLDAFAECAEAFTVPESWFFRAGEQFADLARFARAHPARRPFRVLCLPSAAGEEAWSAAIALLEAGLAPGDFDILGIDVSRSAVRRAEEGIYRRSAFRGQPPPPEWLHPLPDGLFQVAPMLRRGVRFRVGNAIDPLLLRGEEAFDAVFCRNLLIYLHGDARRRLLQSLVAALAPPALVLAGQAEVLSGVDDRLAPLPGGSPLSFRYVGVAALEPTPSPLSGGTWPAFAEAPPAKRNEVPVRGEPRAVSAPAPRDAEPAPKTVAAIAAAGANAASAAAAASAADATPSAAADASVPEPIAHANALADAGRVAEARAVCAAHLAKQPADVAALYLLGLLESATGNTDAADKAFAQVLYLDRDHLDALEQRIALAERRGERGQAGELRSRAARTRQRRGREART